jgi:hypothetical protein
MAPAQSPLIHNMLFDTYPILVHAAGKAEHLPLWPAVLRAADDWSIDTRLDPNLTVITYNNGGTLSTSVSACSRRVFATTASRTSSFWAAR